MTQKQVLTNEKLNKPIFAKFEIEISQSYDVFYDDKMPMYNERVKRDYPALFNSHCIALIHIVCNFPKCKKSDVASYWDWGDKIDIHPLFGHGKGITITKNEFNKMVMECAVVNSKYSPCDNLTDDIIADARKSCLR